MSLLSSLSISASGMAAERLRMDVVADNLANVNTTRTPEGGPFRRRRVLFAPQENGFASALVRARGGAGTAGGVRVVGVTEDGSPPRRVYDPGHPDANADGYVSMPNVDPVTEMVDLIAASRAYEANVTAMQTAKTMFSKTLDLLR